MGGGSRVYPVVPSTVGCKTSTSDYPHGAIGHFDIPMLHTLAPSLCPWVPVISCASVCALATPSKGMWVTAWGGLSGYARDGSTDRMPCTKLRVPSVSWSAIPLWAARYHRRVLISCLPVFLPLGRP